MADNFFEVSLSGFHELEKRLKDLPARIGGKILARAVIAGAGVIRDEAKRLCPKNEGTLAKSIRATRKKGTKQGEIVYLIKPGRGKKANAWYAHLIEFGTAAHIIRAKKKKVLAANGTVYGKVVRHPGTHPRPFLRPAFDTKWREAIEKIRERLGQGIMKEVAK